MCDNAANASYVLTAASPSPDVNPFASNLGHANINNIDAFAIAAPNINDSTTSARFQQVWLFGSP
jgi:hypothetical protein